MSNEKTIVIGGDHAGFSHKAAIIKLLESMGYNVKDVGAYSEDSVDYPDFAHAIAQAIENGETTTGIALCGSGNGISMALNKHQGVRAGLCWNEELAALTRQHNDANVLSIPARFVTENLALRMVKTFLTTDF